MEFNHGGPTLNTGSTPEIIFMKQRIKNMEEAFSNLTIIHDQDKSRLVALELEFRHFIESHWVPVQDVLAFLHRLQCVDCSIDGAGVSPGREPERKRPPQQSSPSSSASYFSAPVERERRVFPRSLYLFRQGSPPSSIPDLESVSDSVPLSIRINGYESGSGGLVSSPEYSPFSSRSGSPPSFHPG